MMETIKEIETEIYDEGPMWVYRCYQKYGSMGCAKTRDSAIFWAGYWMARTEMAAVISDAGEMKKRIESLESNAGGGEQ